MKSNNPLLILSYFIFALACFNVSLHIKYVSNIFPSDEQFENSFSDRGSRKHEVKISNVAHADKVAQSSTTALRSSRVIKSKKKTSDAVDTNEIAQILTKSFSNEDGIPIEDQMGFDVMFKNLNDSDQSTCHCDVLSTDCLHLIACIPHLYNPQYRHALAWIGLQIRHAIKSTSIFDERLRENDGYLPPGKTIQYMTISTWKFWRLQNILPRDFNPDMTSIFVKEDWYPDCREGGLHGYACFFTGLQDSPENFTDEILETEAIQWFDDTVVDRVTVEDRVRKLLEKFVRDHQPQLKDPETGDYRNIDDIVGPNKHMSALGNLFMFSHFVRLIFNIRPFLKEIYQERLRTIGNDGKKLSSPISKRRKINNQNEEPFNVALHMRRGDSCNEHPLDYQSDASPFDSPAQTGGDRLCYKTKVYMDALRQIRLLVPRERPLHVYLATDDVGDMINEIINKEYLTSAEEEIVDIEQWHFVNYPRDAFNYHAETIEAPENKENQPLLGETAVQDLWHLSHGHAFVGHLGSRFGKVAWLLATARHNAFIPFFSVDGHSVCCEIDEACSKVKPFVTVDNCFAFGHEYISYDHSRDGNTYFQTGSLARRATFLENQEAKKMRGEP